MIFHSNLLIVNKNHEFKTFLIPSLDFTLQNGQLKVKDIEKMGNTLGSMVNKLIGGSVPVVVKHASLKDVGLSIPSLKEKSDTCKIKTFLRMFLNKDSLIKELFQYAIEGEKRLRKVNINNDKDTQLFLNWDSGSRNSWYQLHC